MSLVTSIYQHLHYLWVSNMTKILNEWLICVTIATISTRVKVDSKYLVEIKFFFIFFISNILLWCLNGFFTWEKWIWHSFKLCILLTKKSFSSLFQRDVEHNINKNPFLFAAKHCKHLFFYSCYWHDMYVPAFSIYFTLRLSLKTWLYLTAPDSTWQQLTAPDSTWQHLTSVSAISFWRV